jgi:hypothetical protein
LLAPAPLAAGAQPNQEPHCTRRRLIDDQWV